MWNWEKTRKFTPSESIYILLKSMWGCSLRFEQINVVQFLLTSRTCDQCRALKLSFWVQGGSLWFNQVIINFCCQLIFCHAYLKLVLCRLYVQKTFCTSSLTRRYTWSYTSCRQLLLSCVTDGLELRRFTSNAESWLKMFEWSECRYCSVRELRTSAFLTWSMDVRFWLLLYRACCACSVRNVLDWIDYVILCLMMLTF